VLLADLITNPDHSIINQSFQSKLRLDTPLNGDGFGIGWYDNSSATTIPSSTRALSNKQQQIPCIFTSILPAWNNMNLNRLAEKISSRLIFAHVRAASPGIPVTETNCHPFRHNQWMFMHNGYISGFRKILRKLQSTLSDPAFNIVQGSTDSEWLFAVFLNQLPKLDEFLDIEMVINALTRTIEIINELCHGAGIDTASLLNLAVTDGVIVVCTRYSTNLAVEPASLFYSSGTRFECGERYRMLREDKRTKVTIVASEPVTFERSDWVIVPKNTLIAITAKGNVLFRRLVDNTWTV
jgi:glutamine amidotransferase